MPKIYINREELVKDAKKAIGRKISELDRYNRLNSSKGKGRIGQIIQESVFEMKLDSEQDADFSIIKTELKVTGYKWVKNNTLVSAKERLVLTMIDYFEDIKMEFKESNLYHKIENILLMLYEYRDDIPESDFEISNVYMMEFESLDNVDKEIIIQDWHFILNKIKTGRAHELSEGDTMYLGACTKGMNKNSVVVINGIPVMKRAYAFKNSYMTYILRSRVFNDYETREVLIKDIAKLKNNSIGDYLQELFKPFVGKSLSEIDDMLKLNIERSSKNFLKMYVSRMLMLNNCNLDNIEEFNKANIRVKTIRLNKKGKNRESVSFPVIDFNELAIENWIDSTTRSYFENSKFLFMVFDEIDDLDREYRFRSFKLWNMPLQDLDNDVKDVWKRTQDILNSELELYVKKGRVLNNLPKIKQNNVSHIRPHALNSFDTMKLPNSCKIIIKDNDNSKNIDYLLNLHSYTKQCFWLNDSYVLKVIKDE